MSLVTLGGRDVPVAAGEGGKRTEQCKRDERDADSPQEEGASERRSRKRWRGGDGEDSREEDWLDEGISISRGFFSLSTAES